MKKALLIPVIALLGLVYIQKGITEELSRRSVQEKLGYIPSRRAMNIIALDHRPLVAQWVFFKTMTYYGGRIDPYFGSRQSIEYFNMYWYIDVATHLDPYNIDPYYFSEAVFTWGIGRVVETNRILKRALKYRTWDPTIPFFLGFNYFYFLKDYSTAARYMQQVARMKKSAFHASLASRLLYEARATEIAISFLEEMIREIKQENLKQSLLVRLQALRAVQYLEEGIRRFKRLYGRRPADLKELVTTGIISSIPEDPYGGTFYIDPQGQVRSTSDFTFKKNQQWQKQSRQ